MKPLTRTGCKGSSVSVSLGLIKDSTLGKAFCNWLDTPRFNADFIEIICSHPKRVR